MYRWCSMYCRKLCLHCWVCKVVLSGLVDWACIRGNDGSSSLLPCPDQLWIPPIQCVLKTIFLGLKLQCNEKFGLIGIFLCVNNLKHLWILVNWASWHGIATNFFYSLIKWTQLRTQYAHIFTHYYCCYCLWGRDKDSEPSSPAQNSQSFFNFSLQRDIWNIPKFSKYLRWRC